MGIIDYYWEYDFNIEFVLNIVELNCDKLVG